MIYLPNELYLSRYKELIFPLPKRLLDWLYNERGLGVYVLPNDKEKARSLLQSQLGVTAKYLENDGRETILTSHYQPTKRAIIIANKTFWSARAGDVFIHELGHAIDYLYSKRVLSSYPKIYNALRPEKPLTSYCRRKFKKDGNLLEQFATSFSAYFREPEDSGADAHIYQLSDELLKIFNRLFIKPFEVKKRV